MARCILSRICMFRFVPGCEGSQPFPINKCCSSTHDSVLNVIHDRPKQRFTVACHEPSGGVSSAVLTYTFRDDRQVDLISTDVPESHRRKGVAAHLAKAALDFVVQEDLKARISCWYIRKYVKENPHLRFQDYITD